MFAVCVDPGPSRLPPQRAGGPHCPAPGTAHETTQHEHARRRITGQAGGGGGTFNCRCRSVFSMVVTRICDSKSSTDFCKLLFSASNSWI